MGEGRKALKEAFGLRAYMMRENEERKESKIFNKKFKEKERETLFT